MSSRRNVPGDGQELVLIYSTDSDGEPFEDIEPSARADPSRRPGRVVLVASAALLALAGLLFIAGARRPVRFEDRVTTTVDAAPVSGVDAVGCWAGHSCIVRSARLAAYIANAHTSIALDVAGWETVDRDTDTVYRRVLSEFREQPSISIHLIFQCVPNGIATESRELSIIPTVVNGHFQAAGAYAQDVGNGCSAAYNYSVDAVGTRIDPDLFKLHELIDDPNLQVHR